jgi:phage terminase large subunit-like protein
LTSLQTSVRLGSQRPRLEHFPLYATTAADDAIDLAEIAGLNLDPWQQYVLRGSLGEGSNGKWSAFRVALMVPRQNGKNALLEARELAGMFLFGEKLIIHTAHEHATARESMLALMNRVKACPELLAQVKGFDGDVDRDIQGMKTGNDPGITLKNGNRLAYRARSKGSGRGFTGDLVVLDEAYALKLDEMAALLPTMAAKSMAGNPQVWFTSSAGMVDSDLLASIREQGINKTSDRLAYYEWSAEEEAASDDVESWYQANPGLGIRISEEFVRDEYATLAENTGSDEQFKRERMGIWAKIGGESAIPAKAWAACSGDPVVNETPTTVSFAVDVPPSRDSATITMAGDLGEGLSSIVTIDRRPGTDWVAQRLRELQEAWSPVAIVVDAGAAAGSLLPEIRRLRVRTLQVSYKDLGQACGRFFDAVMQEQISHSNQDELNDAVDSSTKKTINDTMFVWNRRNAGDISPLVSATLALHGLTVKGRSREKRQRKVTVL